ncbi:MAG: hypothetical protein LBL63_02165 [Clostridiales Family XIII bacterium]|jgi:hypothetical protein|nr:hypothetical protein [Clostridiales Family XIII bacterium]
MEESNSFTIPVIPITFPKKPRDYPISERENLMRALSGKKPVWMPSLWTSSRKIPNDETWDLPDFGIGKTTDWFGVQYQYSEAQSSGTPIRGIFSEIGEWRDKIAWPDLDRVDWGKDAETFVKDENLACGVRMYRGLFETLHAFEGFEQTLVDLILNPDECRAFFERMADHKIGMFEHFHAFYHLDYVIYNDDWGTTRAPFFSLDLFKKTLLEPTKRIADAIRSKGVKLIFHNCGLIDSFIPCLVEDIGAEGLHIQKINDIEGILRTYGAKTTVDYRPDETILYDPNTTAERARACAREMVDRFGAHTNPGPGIIYNAYAVNEELFYAFDDEVYRYSLEKYRGL